MDPNAQNQALVQALMGQQTPSTNGAMYGAATQLTPQQLQYMATMPNSVQGMQGQIPLSELQQLQRPIQNSPQPTPQQLQQMRQMQQSEMGMQGMGQLPVSEIQKYMQGQ
jgi:hypothetical protein